MYAALMLEVLGLMCSVTVLIRGDAGSSARTRRRRKTLGPTACRVLGGVLTAAFLCALVITVLAALRTGT